MFHVSPSNVSTCLLPMYSCVFFQCIHVFFSNVSMFLLLMCSRVFFKGFHTSPSMSLRVSFQCLHVPLSNVSMCLLPMYTCVFFQCIHVSSSNVFMCLLLMCSRVSFKGLHPSSSFLPAFYQLSLRTEVLNNVHHFFWTMSSFQLSPVCSFTSTSCLFLQVPIISIVGNSHSSCLGLLSVFPFHLLRSLSFFSIFFQPSSPSYLICLSFSIFSIHASTRSPIHVSSNLSPIHAPMRPPIYVSSNMSPIHVSM